MEKPTKCEDCIHFLDEGRNTYNGTCIYLNYRVAKKRLPCSAGKRKIKGGFNYDDK